MTKPNGTGIICPGCGIEMVPGQFAKAHCKDGCGNWLYDDTVDDEEASHDPT